MIDFVTGDIFASGADAIVIPVNAVGVPGKGLALAAARRWPEWAADYKAACRRGELRAGWIHVTRGAVMADRPRHIIALATKDHWRAPSRIEWVESGLCKLRAWAFGHHVRTLAVPALGCGLGGLSWDEVWPIMKSILVGAMCDVRVYGPGGER